MGINNSSPEKTLASTTKRDKAFSFDDNTLNKKSEILTKKQQDSESASSDDDENKFKAAAQANAARLSEKKIYNKLPTQKVGMRKTTIDLDYLMNQSPDEGNKGHNHMIKRGYYAKLGIERSNTNTSSIVHPSKSWKKSEFMPKNSSPKKALSANTLCKKSLSTKNIGVDKLSIGSSDSCKEHSFEEAKLEERKIGLGVIDEVSINL
jgi:phage-related minor tail protein